MYSKTPPLQPIVPSYHLRILSDEQVDQLKSATLRILEKTGIHPRQTAVTATPSRWREKRRTGFWRITTRNRWMRRSRRNSSAFYRRRSGN
jgi:hypothetical protein